MRSHLFVDAVAENDLGAARSISLPHRPGVLEPRWPPKFRLAALLHTVANCPSMAPVKSIRRYREHNRIAPMRNLAGQETQSYCSQNQRG